MTSQDLRQKGEARIATEAGTQLYHTEERRVKPFHSIRLAPGSQSNLIPARVQKLLLERPDHLPAPLLCLSLMFHLQPVTHCDQGQMWTLMLVTAQDLESQIRTSYCRVRQNPPLSTNKETSMLKSYNMIKSYQLDKYAG